MAWLPDKTIWQDIRANHVCSAASREVDNCSQILSPSEWTHFEWKSTKRLRNYISVVTLLTTFLLSELNVFYLKTLLWLPAEHPSTP